MPNAHCPMPYALCPFCYVTFISIITNNHPDVSVQSGKSITRGVIGLINLTKIASY